MMKTFDDLKFERIKRVNGVKSKLMFDNGFGISVIKHRFSYGGENELYEIAVLNSDEEITYETPITKDVIGHLTPIMVSKYMIKIQCLKIIDCENDIYLSDTSFKIINIFTNPNNVYLKELIEKRYVIYDDWNDNYKFKKFAIQQN